LGHSVYIEIGSLCAVTTGQPPALRSESQHSKLPTFDTTRRQIGRRSLRLFPTHARTHTHTASDADLFRGSLTDCRATLRHCCSVDL